MCNGRGEARIKNQDVTPMFANAESYECFMGRWSRGIAPLFVDFAGALNPERVLDVGSGTGSLSDSIATKHTHANVVGIDSAEEYVRYATRRNAFSDRVRFHVGDAHHLPFRETTFEAGLSLLVFNFLPDPGKALNEMKRVTQSGGQAAAAVWDYGSGMLMLRLFWDSAVSITPAAERADEKHMPLCRRGELAGLWRQAGLLNVDEQALEISMRFHSFEEFWDPFLLGQGPAGAYVSGLDSVHVGRLKNEVRRRLPFIHEGGNAHCDLVARAWAVRGKVP